MPFRLLAPGLLLGILLCPDPGVAGWIDPLPHDRIVYGLYPDGDTLRIRGTVSDSLGGVAAAAPIALASDGAISAMPGLPFVARQFLRHEGILYASGLDLYAWKGAGWELAWDAPHSVGPMVVHDDTLVVALFAPDDESKIYRLIDGAWIPYTEHPILGYVDRMASFQGNLYVAGRFGRLGTVNARKIGFWDGSGWNALGVGLSATSDFHVGALLEYEGRLVVAGRFNSAGPVVVSGVAWWDGATWGSFGPASGLTGIATARDAAVHGNELVVVGSFDGYGLLASPSVVRWTGGAWDSMASSGLVTGHAVAVWNDGVWAEFRFLWNVAHSHRLVRWDEPVTATPGRRAPSARVVVTPNPSRGAVTIEATLSAGGPVGGRILDVTGRLVHTLPPAEAVGGRLRVRWDGTTDTGRPAPVGVYFLRLDHAGETVSTRLLRIR